jgi:hypothetical protein
MAWLKGCLDRGEVSRALEIRIQVRMLWQLGMGNRGCYPVGPWAELAGLLLHHYYPTDLADEPWVTPYLERIIIVPIKSFYRSIVIMDVID